jgi:lipocalin
MEFEIAKYEGTFYEIFKQNADFESQCFFSKAEYTLNDTKVLVRNTCYDNNYQEISNIDGVAEPTEIQGVLNLQFYFNGNPGPVGIYTVFQTDYINYSIVGNLDTNYLSILVRDINNLNLNEYLEIAKSFGFKIV